MSRSSISSCRIKPNHYQLTKRAVYGNSLKDSKEKVKLNKEKLEKAEELTGKLSKQSKHDKLMNSVLENDKQTIENGKLLSDAINNNIGSFIPDLMFEQLVKDFSIAKHIYGDKIIQAVSGYDPKYIEKNINIPEFRRDLKQKIAERIEAMKDEKIIDRDYTITEKGYELASLVMYAEELDKLSPKGMNGEKYHKKRQILGETKEVRQYKKDDNYRSIAVRKSIQTAIRRGHTEPDIFDFRSFIKEAKGTVYIIYALDSSGSMKGKKIENCKKAGVALAYKAIQEKDKVGLIVFGKNIKEEIPPTSDFPLLLDKITRIRAFNETDLAGTIRHAIDMFPATDGTKHLILLTDGLPTVGKEPEKETIEAASLAKVAGITISVIGINIDDKGKKVAEEIVNIGEGKLHIVRETENIDVLVLEDYYGLQ